MCLLTVCDLFCQLIPPPRFGNSNFEGDVFPAAGAASGESASADAATASGSASPSTPAPAPASASENSGTTTSPAHDSVAEMAKLSVSDIVDSDEDL